MDAQCNCLFWDVGKGGFSPQALKISLNLSRGSTVQYIPVSKLNRDFSQVLFGISRCVAAPNYLFLSLSQTSVLSGRVFFIWRRKATIFCGQSADANKLNWRGEMALVIDL